MCQQVQDIVIDKKRLMQIRVNNYCKEQSLLLFTMLATSV